MRSHSWRSVCLLFAGVTAVLLVTQMSSPADEQAKSRLDDRAVRIQAALAKSQSWEYIEQPLQDVAAHVGHELEIEVLLDIRALDDYGIDSATPITWRVGEISAKSFLRLMLSELDLTYVIRDDALWITTFEEAEARLITRVYRVGDIVDDGEVSDEPGPDYDTLIQAITSAIAPDSWDQVGGPGSIEGIYGALVVSQTEDVHEQLGDLLVTYRQLRKSDASDKGAGVRPYFLGQTLNENLETALDKPITVMFADAPLRDVADTLSAKLEVPIVLDARALEDYGIGTDQPVSGKFAELSLEVVLRRLLHELELTYVVRNEVISITTPEEVETQLTLGLYPVRDLVSSGSDDPATFDFDGLIDVITSTIAPDTWDEVGGPGSIEPLLPTPALLFAQTQDVHDQIAELLVTLRAAKSHESARKKAEGDSDKVTLRAYHLYPTAGGFVDPDAVIEIVLRATGEEIWEDEEQTFIEPLGQAIVVKHRAQGHVKIRKVLTELGVWAPWSNYKGTFGGPGFGGGGMGVGGGPAPANQGAPQGGGLGGGPGFGGAF